MHRWKVWTACKLNYPSDHVRRRNAHPKLMEPKALIKYLMDIAGYKTQ